MVINERVNTDNDSFNGHENNNAKLGFDHCLLNKVYTHVWFPSCVCFKCSEQQRYIVYEV